MPFTAGKLSLSVEPRKNMKISDSAVAGLHLYCFTASTPVKAQTQKRSTAPLSHWFLLETLNRLSSQQMATSFPRVGVAEGTMALLEQEISHGAFRLTGTGREFPWTGRALLLAVDRPGNDMLRSAVGGHEREFGIDAE